MEFNDKKNEIDKSITLERIHLLKTGDLIFFESDKSIGSSLIELFMSSAITHVGIIIRLDYDYLKLKKDEIYMFELGANSNCKIIMGESETGSRIVEFNDMFQKRQSKIFLKRWFFNDEFMKYSNFAKFLMNKIQKNITNYIFNNISIPYSLTIPSVWFMSTMFPFTLRFFHPWEHFYRSIKNGPSLKPKHCSQMIYFILVNANIFKDTKDSYLISPKDLYINTNDYCFPTIYYAKSIQIK